MFDNKNVCNKDCYTDLKDPPTIQNIKCISELPQ